MIIENPKPNRFYVSNVQSHRYVNRGSVRIGTKEVRVGPFKKLPQPLRRWITDDATYTTYAGSAPWIGIKGFTVKVLHDGRIEEILPRTLWEKNSLVAYDLWDTPCQYCIGGTWSTTQTNDKNTRYEVPAGGRLEKPRDV